VIIKEAIFLFFFFKKKLICLSFSILAMTNLLLGLCALKEQIHKEKGQLS